MHNIDSTTTTYMKEHVGIGEKSLGARKTHRRHLAACRIIGDGWWCSSIGITTGGAQRLNRDVIVNKWRDKQTMAEAEVNKLVSDVS